MQPNKQIKTHIKKKFFFLFLFFFFPDPGTEPRSPTLQADSLPFEPFFFFNKNGLLSEAEGKVLILQTKE